MSGLAGGIQTGLNYGMQAAKIRWQNDQKKKLEAEKVKMQEVWSNFSQSAQEIYESGEMSEETERKLYALMFTLPPELQASANNLLTAVNKNDKAGSEREFNNFSMVMEVLEATGGRIGDTELDSLINLLSPENQEKVRTVTSAYKSVPPQPEDVWGQAGKLPQNVRPDYLRQKGIDIPQPAVTPEKLTGIQAEIAEIDKMTWLTEDRRNKMKVDKLSKGDSATVAKVKAIKAADGTDEDIVKAMGGGVIGPEPTPDTKTRATSLTTLEKYRNNALNADSWQDAEKIIKDYTDAGYDATQLGVTQQDWANIKKSDLDNLVAVLNEITAGTPESRNIKGKKKFAFAMDGKETEKTGEEWYKAVYESYNALLKLLKEQGVDISQYKKLKPLSEIKKASSWTSGFVGGGVEGGDLIKIYY